MRLELSAYCEGVLFPPSASCILQCSALARWTMGFWAIASVLPLGGGHGYSKGSITAT